VAGLPFFVGVYRVHVLTDLVHALLYLVDDLAGADRRRWLSAPGSAEWLHRRPTPTL